ncbi:MAG: hypothetical protein Q4A39_00985 [Eubacteriales bacterium]|nr:hypothetical protein [Eubacteriales bacterium]
MAAELLEKGYVRSVSEAFATLLGEDRGYYVPPVRLQLLDAIKLLRKKHILPVWAHPLQDIDAETLQTLLPKAIEAGLVGMETFHSSYDAKRWLSRLRSLMNSTCSEAAAAIFTERLSR